MDWKLTESVDIQNSRKRETGRERENSLSLCERYIPTDRPIKKKKTGRKRNRDKGSEKERKS